MEAKKVVLMCSTFLFLQTSSASFDHFWPFSQKNHTPTPTDDNWNELTVQQQETLLQRYQSIKDISESQRTALQQKMDWFTQLPEEEQQKMREAWQQMNSQERKKMRMLMQQAKTKEERDTIREEYIRKYRPSTEQNDIDAASMPTESN